MDNIIPVLGRMSACVHSRDLMVLCNLRKNVKIPSRRKFKERRFLRVLLRGQYHLGRMVSKVRSHMHPLFP